MSESEKVRLSVTALADRPNEWSPRYGKKGMSADELKAAFSALPCAIADRLNTLVTELNRVISEINGENEAFGASLSEVWDKCFGGIVASDGGVGFYSVSGKPLGELALASEITEASIPPTSGAVKRYVDAEAAKKLDTVTSEGDCARVYQITSSGAQGTLTLDTGGSEFKWGKIPRRFSNGGIYLPRIEDMPSVKQYKCAIRKDDVDALLSPMQRKIEELECAAKGNIYENVTDSSVAYEKYVVGDALPYGVLSRVGGKSYTEWGKELEFEGSYGSDGGTLLSDGELSKWFAPGARFKLTAECDGEETTSGVVLSLSYFSTEIDSLGVIYPSLGEEAIVPDDAVFDSGYPDTGLRVTVYGDATVSGITLHTYPSEKPTAVTAVELYGKNIANVGAITAHSSGSVSIDGDTLLWASGSKYYLELPVDIPSGSVVTASCVYSGAENDRIEKVTYIGETGEEITVKLGVAVTLDRNITKARFCKYSQATALIADMRIRELQIEYGDRASAYVPYVGDEPVAVLTVPEMITSLADYGCGGETLYNYIDLLEKKYYRCVDGELNALNEPEVTDVSGELDETLDTLPLTGVGRVVFRNAERRAVPSVLSYKRKL